MVIPNGNLYSYANQNTLQDPRLKFMPAEYRMWYLTSCLNASKVMTTCMIYSDCVTLEFKYKCKCLVTWQQHCAMSFGGSQSQLVKGHHLTTCLQDPAAGTIGYSQSTDLREKKTENKECECDSQQHYIVMWGFLMEGIITLLETKVKLIFEVCRSKREGLPSVWGYPESWHHQ